MPRPQFTLKTLLVWATTLPLSTGIFTASFTATPERGFLMMWLAGALFGATIGHSKGRDTAIFGACLGGLFVFPITFLAFGALASTGFIDLD